MISNTTNILDAIFTFAISNNTRVKMWSGCVCALCIKILANANRKLCSILGPFNSSFQKLLK